MELDMTNIVKEIAMQAQETQDEFIIETIYPYCEDVLQMKINKEELKQILLNGMQKQQPCEDCISREAVIEWLKDKDIIKMNYQEENARRELAELPSVTPQQTGWIPVSERLPEEDGTLRGYLVNVGYWVGIAPFVDGEFWQSYVFKKMRFDYPVKAWMPLPEPYAESDKEEEE